MNISIVNHYAVPPSEPFGTRHFSLARELSRRGHRPTIFASSFRHGLPSSDQNKSPHLTKYDSAEVQGVRFVWIPTPSYSGNGMGRLWNMMRFAQQICRWHKHADVRPDIIIGSNPHLFAALAAYRVARQCSIPFVFEVRDLWPLSFVEILGLSRRHPLVLLLGLIEQHLYRHATRIITLLPGSERYITSRGGRAEKITVIPNGIDLELVEPPTPLPQNPCFTICYAGAHGQANCLETVLDAAAILKREGWEDRVQFHFYGDGTAKERLVKQAKSKNLQSVKFFAPVPKQQVYTVLCQADALVVSMSYTALYQFGSSLNKFFDYLATARPIVIASRFDNPITAAQAGITVPPEDPRAMAAAFQQIASATAQERWNMGMRGRAYVEKHHDISVLADNLEAVLCEAAAEYNGSRSGTLFAINPRMPS